MKRANRRLAALLARVLPARGRHSRLPVPELPAPQEPVPGAADQGYSPSDLTVFDVPPTRARRYMQPGSEDVDEDGQGGWLP